VRSATRICMALALILPIVLAACASNPETAASQRSEIVVAEIRSQIALGRPEIAVGRISGLRRDDLLSGVELDGLQAEAVERIEQDLSAALQSDDFSEAIRLFRNLEVLDEVSPPDVNLNDLYVGLARAYQREGNGPAAIAIMLRLPELSSLPVETLEEFARGAMLLNNRYAAGVAAQVLGDHWLRENGEIAEFIAGATSPADAVASTVTVWVNRGIRLEGGVGYADRVIGSGFFIDPRGYLITNHHVIASEVDTEYEGYSRLYIRLPDDPDERVPARVVGYDRIFDIALLKVELDAPYVLSFTDLRSLEPGRRIIAIGSPGGLENTITSGIISATGRRFLQMGDALQVDVPINPGSSGGPLLDENGNVVAVVFAGIEQFEGVNFAIPSYWIQPLLPSLYRDGEVVHPWIGVAVEPVADGLEVSYVAPNSPALAAGIVPGDVITHLGPWEAPRIVSAQRIILSFDPGSLIQVTWLRDNQPMNSLIALQERPYSPLEVALEADVHDRLYPVLYGMQVSREGLSGLFRLYRVDRVYRGSVADETGITVGDTFTEREFSVDDELGIAFLRIVVKKRTEGFMQTGIQLPAYIETDSFL
jgi:serine protease Do